MISAVPVILEKIPDVIYFIVGKGPELSRLRRLIRKLGVDGSVLITDQKLPGQLRAYSNACDVFVLPSRQILGDHEGFGIVLLEASACGKPVVGTRSGGIPDAVVEGATGILVSPESAEELATAVFQILTDPGLAERLGLAGRDHVISTASWDVVSDTLYQSRTTSSL